MGAAGGHARVLRPRARPVHLSAALHPAGGPKAFPGRAAAAGRGRTAPAGDGARSADPLGWLIHPNERRAPIVTVHDAAPHSLAWLGSVYGAPATALGVERHGQSGARADLYRYYGVDAANIAEMALRAVDE